MFLEGKLVIHCLHESTKDLGGEEKEDKNKIEFKKGGFWKGKVVV
jgi:hypothetical protein